MTLFTVIFVMNRFCGDQQVDMTIYVVNARRKTTNSPNLLKGENIKCRTDFFLQLS